MDEDQIQETTVIQVQDAKPHTKKKHHKKSSRNRKKKLTKGGILFFRIVLVAALGMACWSGWNIYAGLKAYHDSMAAYENLAQEVQALPSETESAGVQPTVNFEELASINPDVVGWLKLDGTVVNYPVVQGTDNEYYLEHLFDGAVNHSGTIFVDCRNTPGFVDRNTAMYAHHMRNGSMFAEIENYKDQAYADAHPKFRLETPDGIYDIYPFAGMFSDGYTDYVQIAFKDDNDFMAYVNDKIARSTFTSDVEVAPEDQIITFSTCSYNIANGRYALFGKLLPAQD